MNLSGDNFEKLSRMKPREKYKKEVHSLNPTFENPIIYIGRYTETKYMSVPPLNFDNVMKSNRLNLI